MLSGPRNQYSKNPWHQPREFRVMGISTMLTKTGPCFGTTTGLSQQQDIPLSDILNCVSAPSPHPVG